MKVLRTDRKSGEQEEFEINEKAIKKYGERTAFALSLFFYQPGCSSFSEWLDGLNSGIDNMVNSERVKDICYNIKSSEGVFSYTNEDYSWIAIND